MVPRLNWFKDIAVLTLQGWILCAASGLVFSGSLTSRDERLVDSLLSAKTENASTALLRNKAAVTPPVRKILLARAEGLSTQGRSFEALSAYKLAFLVSEQINDRAEMAKVVRAIGDIECSQGGYLKAIQSYRQSLKLGEELGSKELISLALKSIWIEECSLPGQTTQANREIGARKTCNHAD